MRFQEKQSRETLRPQMVPSLLEPSLGRVPSLAKREQLERLLVKYNEIAVCSQTN